MSAALHLRRDPGVQTWNVTGSDERANDRDQDSLGCAVPELEFWESPDEGTELLILLGGKRRLSAALHFIILVKRRVKLRSQEREE